MSRTGKDELNQRKEQCLMLLQAIASETGKEAAVSMRDLSGAMGVSKERARYTVRQLEREKLIRRKVRFRDDGGQTASGFAITPKGESVLLACGCRKETKAKSMVERAISFLESRPARRECTDGE